ncbi:MAG TPA: hypothetical protein EYG40_01810 [Verrucomicrobia bacterium]|nr:hypothetical protein [Verrucomicrobiales bacterium]HIL53754.1 hypothetical protein [Verrucomicrobiota bacterium]
MLKIECPKCGTPLEVPDDKTQGKGRCSTCETKFLIPASEDDEIEIIDEEKTDVVKSKQGDESINEEESGKDKDGSDEEELSSEDQSNELSEDFIARWLKVLGLITVGLIIGIILGFYVGRFTATPEDEFYQSEPSIKSRGDTIDPFGIDNN